MPDSRDAVRTGPSLLRCVSLKGWKLAILTDATTTAASVASPTGRFIGEARSYDELIALFRQRCAELGTSMERLDDIAGLPQRYISKLLAPLPVKGIGKISLGPLLGCLGLSLTVNEDAQALAKIKHRLVPNKNTGTSMLAQKNGYKRFLIFRGNPDLARLSRKRQVLKQSPRKRRRIARYAALIRWRGVRGARAALRLDQRVDRAPR